MVAEVDVIQDCSSIVRRDKGLYQFHYVTSGRRSSTLRNSNLLKYRLSPSERHSNICIETNKLNVRW